MRVLWFALFFTILLIGAFYTGYRVALDIFELACFHSVDEPVTLFKLLLGIN